MIPNYRHNVVAATIAMTASFYWPVHAHAEAPRDARLVVLSQTDDSATLLLTVPSIAAGTRIDPASVSVRLNGEETSVTSTALTRQSLPELRRRAMLVVDVSGSMAADLGDARQAALTFLAAVPPDVEVGLVVFSDRAKVAVSPTTSRTTLRHALRSLRAAGETSLYDGIARGVDALGSSGERELVVLSDGADTRSLTTQAQVGRLLARSGVRMDAVAFNTGDTVRRTLRRLVRVVRGRLTTAYDAADLAAAFSTAARSFDARLRLDIDVPASLGDRTVRVDVVVRTTAGAATASTVLEAPAAAIQGSSAAPADHTPVGDKQRLYLILLVLFVAFTGLASTVLVSLDARRSPKVRARQLLGQYTYAAPVASQRDTDQSKVGSGTLVRRALAIADRVAANPARQTKLTTRLARADMRFSPSEWLVVQFLLMLGGLGIGAVLFGNVVVGVLLAGLGYFGSNIWLNIKARRRLRAFDEHLPNALQLLAGSLRSGFSLEQALDALAREGREPISGEVHRALSDVRLGIPVDDALDRMAERMDSTDFRWVVMAIRIQREVGGNLGEVLLNTAGMMRERARLRRQVKVLSAEGRLSAYVLLALPILISLYLLAFRRTYLHPLYSEPLGIGMLAFAVVLLAVGGVWMRKVVAVEV